MNRKALFDASMTIDCDNAAVMAGYSKEVMAYNPTDGTERYLLVPPTFTAYGTLFDAFDTDLQKMVKIEGWRYETHAI